MQQRRYSRGATAARSETADDSAVIDLDRVFRDLDAAFEPLELASSNGQLDADDYRKIAAFSLRLEVIRFHLRV
jgi:hypothetical protein